MHLRNLCPQIAIKQMCKVPLTLTALKLPPILPALANSVQIWCSKFAIQLQSLQTRVYLFFSSSVIIVALDFHNSNTNVESASKRWVSRRPRRHRPQIRDFENSQIECIKTFPKRETALVIDNLTFSV